MTKFNHDSDIEDILERFPFSRQELQKEKLARYFMFSPGLNKLDVQSKTGISQPTIRKIQQEYMELSDQQKADLIEGMTEFYRENIL